MCCVHLAFILHIFHVTPYTLVYGAEIQRMLWQTDYTASSDTGLHKHAMPAVHMCYISHTHSYKNVKNRTHVDITFFNQNDLRNHLLKVRHEITGRMYKEFGSCLRGNAVSTLQRPTVSCLQKQLLSTVRITRNTVLCMQNAESLILKQLMHTVTTVV
jgi:hypothetical protein